MALLEGAVAPDFTLPGWYEDAPGSFQLSAQRGKSIVLAFYPGDERLVCTKQMCAYSDNLADLHRYNAVVWGISPQDLDSHRAFAAGRALRMPLLSDQGGVVAREYGVLGAFGLRRSVFIVGPHGQVAWRRTAAVNLTFPAVTEIRAALENAAKAA